MDVFEKMLSTQALMFVYIVIGVIISKTRTPKPEGRSSYIGLLINVTLPCMIVNAFNQEVSVEELIAAGHAMLLSAACCIAAWGAGKLLWRREPAERRAVLEFATMFSNAGNAGLPIVSLVFGAKGVFYASFYLIPIRVLMWTLGVSLFVGGQRQSRLKTLLLNPSLLAVFVGLPLMLAPFELPSVLAEAIGNVGAMTGPLSMMIIGASLADMNPREMAERDAFLLSFVRLIAMPLLAMACMRLLGVETLLWQVAVTLLAMPAASNTAILAEMYGRDHAFAAKCVFVSTVLSFITVPCLTLLF
ncbi:MAG: AEC family transporter [Clostridia bacterium]|nr:AEC family transporter [Clostridia bacterium]